MLQPRLLKFSEVECMFTYLQTVRFCCIFYQNFRDFSQLSFSLTTHTQTLFRFQPHQTHTHTHTHPTENLKNKSLFPFNGFSGFKTNILCESKILFFYLEILSFLIHSYTFAFPTYVHLCLPWNLV